MTPTKEEKITAYKTTIKVWTCLFENPELESKRYLPDELKALIDRSINYCALCQIFLGPDGYNEPKATVCTGCPLVVYGSCTYAKGIGYVPFEYWSADEPVMEDDEEWYRKVGAGTILNLTRKALRKLEEEK